MTENSERHIGTINRLKRAFVVSLHGLRDAWRGEQAFRIEVCVAAVFIPVAFLLPVSLPMQLILAGSLVLIMIVELINSAIEAIVDMVTRERHPLAKNAKDMGSAAVLLCIVQALVVWSVALWKWLSAYLT